MQITLKGIFSDLSNMCGDSYFFKLLLLFGKITVGLVEEFSVLNLT